MPHRFFQRLLTIASLLVAIPAVAMDVVTTDGESDNFNQVVSSGKWSLVMLWAHDCVPCERQKPMIERFYKRTGNRGVNVVGLSADEKSFRQQAIATYQATQTSFPNFYFNGANFATAFSRLTGSQFLGTPTYMVFAPDGSLEGVHTGPITRALLDQNFTPKLTEPPHQYSADLLR